MKCLEVQKEYERIRNLFSNCDETQLAVVDGAIWEAARLRAELNGLNEIIAQTGLIKVNPQNPNMQKELPVSRMVVRVRANYLNYISKISSILGKSITDDEEELSDYE